MTCNLLHYYHVAPKVLKVQNICLYIFDSKYIQSIILFYLPHQYFQPYQLRPIKVIHNILYAFIAYLI